MEQPENQRRAAPVVGIVGGGALGCLFAALLESHGTPATILSRRPDVVDHLRLHGVRVRDESTDSGGTVEARPAALHTDEARGPFDVVLLLNKSYDTEWAVRVGQLLVAEEGVVISLQNGLRTVPIVEAAERGVAGTTYQGAGFGPDGTVVWSVAGPTLAAPGAPLLADTKRLLSSLTSPRLPFAIAPDRDVMVWTKLIGAISNSVSGALLVPVAEALQSDHVWAILERARGEAFEIAEALNVGLDRSAMEGQLVIRPKAASRGTTGSTYQSLTSGRRTEVADISGAIAETAAGLGRHAPYNELLNLLVAAREELAASRR